MLLAIVLVGAACSLWVISGHSTVQSPCPLYPRNRHSLAKRFNELSKLDGFLRAGTVPVITVPLALWRTAAGTVHAADLPASHRGCTTRISGAL
jgi:hypothetical protein